MVGTPKDTGMFQETVTGIMNLLKQTKQLDATIAVDIHEVLAAKLEKHHVDTALNFIHARLSTGSGNTSTKQKNRYLDNYLTECHWQCYQDPNAMKDDKFMSMVVHGGLQRRRETFPFDSRPRDADGGIGQEPLVAGRAQAQRVL